MGFALHLVIYEGKSVKKVFVALLLFLWGVTYAQAPLDFEQAKKVAKQIWNENRKTFYCDCRYDRHGVIQSKSCFYLFNESSRYIGWEHVVPVSWYGRQLSCWQFTCITRSGKSMKGRNCCRKISKKFRRMEADLHNLVPVIQAINRARSDYAFGILPENAMLSFNQCDFQISRQFRLADPPNLRKGMIARIYLYLTEKYQIDLNEDQKQQFIRWNQQYPPSAWEKRWNQKVAFYQGDFNPYISAFVD